MNERTYLVTVSHPTGFHKGTIELTIHNATYEDVVFYTASNFGTSRDFAFLRFLGEDETTPIRKWMAEHLCTVLSIKKKPSPKRRPERTKFNTPMDSEPRV